MINAIEAKLPDCSVPFRSVPFRILVTTEVGTAWERGGPLCKKTRPSVQSRGNSPLSTTEHGNYRGMAFR